MLSFCRILPLCRFRRDCGVTARLSGFSSCAGRQFPLLRTHVKEEDHIEEKYHQRPAGIHHRIVHAHGHQKRAPDTQREDRELLLQGIHDDQYKENDKADMEAYGLDWKKMTESDCVADLMKMYEKLMQHN